MNPFVLSLHLIPYAAYCLFPLAAVGVIVIYLIRALLSSFLLEIPQINNFPPVGLLISDAAIISTI